MKHIGTFSIALLSLTLVGAGCGAAKTASNAPADQGAAPQQQMSAADMVKAKLDAAGIAYTTEDKTSSVVSKVQNADAASAFGTVTSFKFASAPSANVLVAEAKDKRGGIVSATLGQQFEAIKAAAPKYQTEMIFPLSNENQATAFVYSSDDATAAKAISDALNK